MLNLQSIYFGQRHPKFMAADFAIIKKVARLAHKHQRQCENDCNGEGWIRGQFYRCDSKAGYVGENTVFYVERVKIENKIDSLVKWYDTKKQWRVEYQHDPRGCTVKLFYEDEMVYPS